MCPAGSMQRNKSLHKTHCNLSLSAAPPAETRVGELTRQEWGRYNETLPSLERLRKSGYMLLLGNPNYEPQQLDRHRVRGCTRTDVYCSWF